MNITDFENKIETLEEGIVQLKYYLSNQKYEQEKEERYKNLFKSLSSRYDVFTKSEKQLAHYLRCCLSYKELEDIDIDVAFEQFYKYSKGVEIAIVNGTVGVNILNNPIVRTLCITKKIL